VIPVSAATTRRGERTREEILAAATAVVLEAGAESFSLREVARRAELSPSALYNHFSSREDIIMAIAIRGLGALSAHLTAASQDGAASCRLRALSAAYIRFSRERNSEYRLVFDCLENQPTSWEGYLRIAEPFTLIVAACADGLASGELVDRSGTGPGTMAYALWALCHGHAMLTSKHLKHVDGDFETLALAGIDALLAGYTKKAVTS